jgi:ATP-binding cassette, subfamily B, bacterial MsbA
MTGLGMIIPVLNGFVDPDKYEPLLTKWPRVAEAVKYSPLPLDNSSIFAIIVLIVLTCTYLENICYYLSQSFANKLSMEVADNLRGKIFNRYLSFGKSFHDKKNIGELNLILTSFVSAVAQHLHHVSMWLMVSGFCLGFLLLMLVISWRLTLTALLLIPIVHLISTRMTKVLNSASQNEADSTVELSELSHDILSNLTLVQLSASEKEEEEAFKRLSSEIASSGITSRNRRSAIPRIADTINSTGIILLACGAAFLFFKVENSSIGRLSAFFISLKRLTSHLELFISYWTQCLTNIPSLEKVAWIFDDSDKTFLKSGTLEIPEKIEELEFKNVSFSYDEKSNYLNEITFTAKRGEMIAIIGQTGAGKTTLVNLIPRFYEPSSGVILLNKINLKDLSSSTLRTKISFVNQHPFILNKTIKENISYGLKPEQWNKELLIEATKNAHFLSFIKSLPNGFDTMLGPKGVRLSGGELQRLSLARAFLRNPDILILDEPTSALDAITEKHIQEALLTLIPNRITILIAHRLATIKACSQVIVMEQGRIVENGTTAELWEKEGGLFRHYCNLQGIVH